MLKHFNKTEWDFFIVALTEEARTVLNQVGSDANPRALVESLLPDLEALAPREEGLSEEVEKETWNKIREVLLRAAYKTRPYCIRCGTCCSKCSPTLAQDDMHLFVKGILKPGHAVTIRKGEPARSPITGEVAPADEEMIKIRERSGTTTCMFYEASGKSCTVYESRPIQCRHQECWNPQRMTATLDLPKLDRKPLLEPAGSLWEIIQRHEDRCSYAELARVMARLSATKGQTVDNLIEMLEFDRHVRDFVADHFSLTRDTMDFFFGRPLRETIIIYGLAVEDQPDGTFLLKSIEEKSYSAQHRTPR